MFRPLLCLALLGLALTAHAISPARQGAGGDGSHCPQTEASASETTPEAGTPPAQNSAPAKVQTPVRGSGNSGLRPRSGSRWHSFLPGMLK